MKVFSPEHVDLANWVRSQQRDACSRIALRQRVHDVEQHVREWALEPTVDADALAEEIRVKASDEGRQLRGPTLYGVFAYRPGASSHHDRKLFRVEGMGAGADSLLGETESADPRGMVSQMMRHTEASARIALGQTLEIVEHYKGILRQRDARIAELEEKHSKVIELYEQLTSMQHQRDLEIIREKRNDKKHDFVREKLDMLAPVVMSKMLGRGTSKGDGSMFGEDMLRGFLASLKPEQMNAIMGALNPEQVVTMAEIYQKYGEREMERQKAAEEREAKAAAQSAQPGE